MNLVLGRFALVVSIALVACQGGDKPASSSSAAEPPAAAPAEPPAAAPAEPPAAAPAPTSATPERDCTKTYSMEEALKVVAEFEKEACSCKDAACAATAQGRRAEVRQASRCFTGTLVAATSMDTWLSNASRCIDKVAAPSPVVIAVEDMATRACACKDAACGAAIQQELSSFVAKNADLKGSEGQKNAIQAAIAKLQGCTTKLSGGASP